MTCAVLPIHLDLLSQAYEFYCRQLTLRASLQTIHHVLVNQPDPPKEVLHSEAPCAHDQVQEGRT